MNHNLNWFVWTQFSLDLVQTFFNSFCLSLEKLCRVPEFPGFPEFLEIEGTLTISDVKLISFSETKTIDVGLKSKLCQ